MVRRRLIPVIAIVLVASAAGCTGSSDSTTGSSTASAGGATSPAVSSSATPTRAQPVVLPSGPGLYPAVSPGVDGTPLAAESGVGSRDVSFVSIPSGSTKLLMRLTCDSGTYRVTDTAGQVVFGGDCKLGAISQSAKPLDGGVVRSIHIDVNSTVRWAFSAAAA